MATKKKAKKKAATATKWQKLVGAKAKLCKGSTTKTAVKKAASAYVKDAVAKAVKSADPSKKVKARKAATKKAKSAANKILKAGCKMSSVIAGKRKKRSTRKK